MIRLRITRTDNGLSNSDRRSPAFEVRGGETWNAFEREGKGAAYILSTVAAAALGRQGPGDDEIEFGFPQDRPGQVGILFDDASWSFCNLRVDEEVAFVLENSGVAPEEMPERIRRVLARVGLSGFEHRSLSTLSGGELRRLALAAVLIGEPKLILSDDLDGHLDLEAIDALEAVIAAHVAETDGAWVNFRRRWDGFGTPANAFATIEQGELRAHRSDDVSALSKSVGAPFGVALHRRLAPDTPAADLGFGSAEEAVSWLATMGGVVVSSARTPVSSGVVLSLEDITFGYDGRRVLRGATLELRQGAVHVLAGRNGAGKSTLARIACGLAPPDAGRAVLLQRKAPASLLRKSTALVFQKPEYQFLTDSVEDELRLAGGDHRVASGPSDEETLQVFQLEGLGDRHPFSLTIGQKRRLAVGCAIVGGRPIIIVDEPTLGQDAEQTELLGRQLRLAASTGRAVLVITHDPHFIVAYCDHVSWLSEGVIKSLGTPHTAFASGVPEMFSGKSHLVRFWELAKAANLTRGLAPRSIGDLTVRHD